MHRPAELGARTSPFAGSTVDQTLGMTDEILERAAAAGYTLTAGQWHGRPAWKWKAERGPTPFFLDRGQAVRWVADLLRRRRHT
jgi:hypothetical protein